MRRRLATTRGMRAHRARPVVEGLEGRQLLSAGASRAAADQAPPTPGGVLSSKGQVFRYVTISGGIATLRVVGIGSLAGTSVDAQGNLDVVYGGTNAYSKVVGTVKGGGGLAPLGSIRNLQLIQAGRPDSLNGVGGTPLAAVLMNNFDLVAGGTINLTPGVTNVVLHSIGPNTNVQLRNLPPHPSYRILPNNPGNTAGGQSGLYGQLVSSSSSSSIASNSVLTSTSNISGNTGTFGGSGTNSLTTGSVPSGGLSPTETIVGTTIVPIVTGNSSLSSGGSTGSSSTLEAGQSATITTAQGVSLSYATDGGRSQVLTNVSGSFTAQPNLLEPLAPGQAQTEPPAPPGIILKAKTIGAAGGAKINPLLDAKIFGYDPTAGQVVRFNLNLQTGTGSADPTFAPIAVPGAPATSDIDLTRVGNTPLVLVPVGNLVYAYNAATGAPYNAHAASANIPANAFATFQPVTFLATAGNITTLGSTAVNQIHMIDVPASLRTGYAQGLNAAGPLFVPQSEVYLLGGATGVSGSSNLYASIAAHFTALQPDQYQLGVASIGTTAVSAGQGQQGTRVLNQFSLISQSGLVSNGNYTTVQVNPIPPTQIGPALGSVDQNLALETSSSGGKDVLTLYSPSLSPKGRITLAYPHQLTGLSQSFRTDLGSAAVIDVQGDVQSVRGNTADGMLFNDTGNLATIKIQHINNSTVVGQPISHIVTRSRNNDLFLTSSRLAGDRNGAFQVSGIQPIGPANP